LLYTVAVTNNGPSDAANVSFADTLPPGTTFVAASQTGGPEFACTTPAAGGTGTITCTIASFKNQASATFGIVLRVSLSAGGRIINTVAVTAAGPDPVSENGSSAATTLIAAARVTAAGDAAPGEAAAGFEGFTALAIAILGLTLSLVGYLLVRARRRPSRRG
jgi:uncharacterized repeat protein (TIGR01451 family)